MVLEVAILDVRVGQCEAFESAFAEAQTIIAGMPGYQRHELQHCLENSNRYLLLVWWDDLESHTVGFRGSKEYQRWKQLLHDFYDPFPTVEHYSRADLGVGHTKAASAPASDDATQETIRIRAYDDADRDQVVALWKQAFPNAPSHNDPLTDIRHKCRNQRELFLVACADGDGDGNVIGSCMAGDDGHRGWLHLVAVDRDTRRRGVGTLLVRRATALLAERGCPKANLQVRAPDSETVAFYERLGFAVEDRISMGVRLPAGGPD